MGIVTSPRNLDLEGALRLSKMLRADTGAEIIIDFSKLNWVEPLAMLLVVCSAREMTDWFTSVRVINADLNGYAQHMGFFAELDDSISVTASRRSSDRYIAIRRIETGWFKSEARARMAETVQDFIQQHAGELAQVLTQNSDRFDELNETLEFCFQEIMRNSYEHSESDEFLVCAQYWPSMNRVDVAVADRGRGLQKSLANNPFLAMNSDRDAVNFALLPGISGKAFKGAPVMRDVPKHWKNSGYGLYMTHRLGLDAGSFIICSGTDGLRFINGDKRPLEDIHHKGTIVGLSIDPTKVGQLQKRLEVYRNEGRVIASNLEGATVDASTASMALKYREEPDDDSEIPF